MTYDQLPTLRSQFATLHEDPRLLPVALHSAGTKAHRHCAYGEHDRGGERHIPTAVCSGSGENDRIAAEIEKVKQSTKGEWA